MKKITPVACIIFCATIMTMTCLAQQPSAPPATRIVDVIETVGGVSAPDPYRWLEGKNPEVTAWAEAQNAYTRSRLDAVPLRAALLDRLLKLHNLQSVSIPQFAANGRVFWKERPASSELSVLFYKEGEREPKIILDERNFSADRKATFPTWNASPNGNLVAFQFAEKNSDYRSVRLLSVSSGKLLPNDEIPADRYPFIMAWEKNETGFWYAGKDPAAPKGEERYHRRIFFHRLGTNPQDDQIVFGRGRRKTDIPSGYLSDDGRWLAMVYWIRDETSSRTEMYLRDTQDPDGAFEPIIEGQPGSFDEIQIHRGMIYLTADNGSPRWRIIATPATTAKGKPLSEWKTIIPQGVDTIQNFRIIRDRIFVHSTNDTRSTITSFDLAGNNRRNVIIPEGGVRNLSGPAEGDALYFDFTSYLSSRTIYRINLSKGESLEVFRKPSTGINEEDFEVRHEWFTSKDGTRVPLSILGKKNFPRDGKNPTILYGYGGFNAVLSPVFNPMLIPFLEHGGVYAQADALRGDGKFGETWHQAGIGINKQNTFDDFAAAAKFLEAQGIATSDYCVPMGQSNGGMLVATTITQQPNLCKLAVAINPVTDMLRYHRFDGGDYWKLDFLSPEDPKTAPYLLGYSPYHNVKDGTNYPTTLILTGTKDDRASPSHAFKFAARLQAVDKGQKTFLRVEPNAGHSGPADATSKANLDADILAFIFSNVKMR